MRLKEETFLKQWPMNIINTSSKMIFIKTEADFICDER